jgi:hypothetical protein
VLLQFNYILQLIKPILSGDLKTVEPKQEATDKYNGWLDHRLTNSVFSQCVSWYRTGGNGRMFSPWPGPIALFWWIARTPRWGDYKVEGPRKKAWKRLRNLKQAIRVLSYASLMVAGGLFASRSSYLPLALRIPLLERILH